MSVKKPYIFYRNNNFIKFLIKNKYLTHLTNIPHYYSIEMCEGDDFYQ